MTESLGTARLDIVVGTEQFDAAIQQAQTRITGMSSAAQAEYAKLNAAEKRRIDSLLKQADTYGKTRAEVILYNAALKGTPTHILDELKNKLGGAVKPAADLGASLKASGKAAADATKQINQYGISAKQQAAALRGVPAQITDIFTSLASGQRPITVLLQQGGQLKDMFGGTVPAIRALGGALLGLINPYTLAAAAAVGLGLAWKSAVDEAQALNQAIIQTGDYAGKSAAELGALASKLDATTSATGRFAADVLAQVVATGRFTGESVEVVSTAIINMAKATQLAGGDVDETIKGLIKSFTDLSKDPVEALLKLNETQHFLTRSTLDQVESLVEQGKQTEAAEVAIKAMADTLNTRAPEMERNVNSASAAFGGLKSVIAETADAAVNFFRNADISAQSFLRNHESVVQGLAKLQSFPLLPFGGAQQNITQSLLSNAKNVPEPILIGFKRTQPTVDSQVEREAIAFKDKYLTREENKKKAIAELDRLRSHYTKEEYEILKKGIEDRFKPPKGSKTDPSKGIESATSRAAIQAFEDQLKKEQGLIANQTQVLEANYAARNVSVAKYYAEQKRLAEENTSAQERALEGEIAALQARALKGKDSINNTRELAEKEAQLAKVRADGATKLEVLNIQEAAQLKQRQQANIAYQDALDQGREALKAELDSQVLRISVGEREFEIRTRIIQLYRDEAKELLNLARQRDAGEIDPETYKARVDQLKAAIADEVKIVRDGYDAMAEAQKNWANGALKAFADYNDAANDVAGQTYEIFSNAIGGLEDVFVDFFTKGKADWKGFFDDIAAEIIRFSVRQQLNKIIQKFMPGGNEDGSSAQALTTAASSLAGSAAPLYGAAAALQASAAALAAAGTGGAATGDQSSGGGWLSSLASLFSSSGGTTTDGWFGFWKNGGAFANGMPVNYFAKGDIFDQATAFPMRGGMGVMGEAGPEAIMPLKRGSDGRLGVEVTAGSRSATLNQTFVVQGTPDGRTREMMARESGRAARRGMQRTG